MVVWLSGPVGQLESCELGPCKIKETKVSLLSLSQKVWQRQGVLFTFTLLAVAIAINGSFFLFFCVAIRNDWKGLLLQA